MGNSINFKLHINSHMLSPNTNYAIYIVYKLPEEVSDDGFERPLGVSVEADDSLFNILFNSDDDDEDFSYTWEEDDDKEHFVFLYCPKTLLITHTPENNQRLSNKNPLHRPKVEGTPRQREDGWMEAQIWAFTVHANAATSTSSINKKFDLAFYDYKSGFTGLILQGIDIRPK